MKKFLGVYHEWGCDMKYNHAKMTTEKDLKKLVEGYNNYNGSGIKVKKTPGSTATNPS